MNIVNGSILSKGVDCPASPSYILEGKPKGQLSILDGKANVSGSSFQYTLQSNSWSCRMEIILKRTSKQEEGKTTYQALHQIRPSSYDDAGLLAIATDQSSLRIHEQGRYLKYESYFTQTCMIFFILCLAIWMLSYSVVHAGLVLLVGKSHTPFTNWADLPLK